MQDEFGYTKVETEMILRRNVIDFKKWHDLVVKNGIIPNVQNLYLIVMTIMIAHFLLTPTDDKPSSKVLEVAHILQEGNHDVS